MATRYQLAEQARRLYKGQVGDDVKVSMKEVMLLVDQAASQSFVSGRVNTELPIGETIPDTTVIVEYEVDVASGGKDARYSTSVLPIYPIRLERQMGVWRIYDKNKIFDDFVPSNGFMSMTRGMQEGYIEGLVLYEVAGNKVRYSKNLPEKNINKVIMELLTVDPSKLGDYDPYPVPKNHEGMIVEKVLQLLMNRPQVIDQTNDGREQV